MLKSQKATVIAEIQKRFESSGGIYFTSYKGMSVGAMTDLRARLRASGVSYKVSKNTLTLMAAKNSGFEGLDDILKGQIGIAFSGEDPAEPARVLKKFFKDEKPPMEMVGILFEGKVYPPEKLAEFSELPTHDELLSKLLSALNSPMTKLAATLNGAMGKFARVLSSLKDTKN